MNILIMFLKDEKMYDLENFPKNYRLHIVQEIFEKGKKKPKRWDVYISNEHMFGTKKSKFVSVQGDNLEETINKAMRELKYKETELLVEEELLKLKIDVYLFQWHKKQIVKEAINTIINDGVDIKVAISEIIRHFNTLEERV